MKPSKTLLQTLLILLLMSSNFQCSSSKYKLEEKSSIKTNTPYFQDWVAGIKNGGSGYNLFFPNLNSEGLVKMDSVYFRKLKGKLLEQKAMYTVKLTKPSPYATETKEEFFPFSLSANECVVSYIENGETKYLKINNIKEKEGQYYPSAPPRNQKDN